MLNKIKRFFEENLLPVAGVDDDGRAIQFATAALMLELARADFEQDEREATLIVELLEKTFGMTQADLQNLLALAASASEEANDVFQFTQLVNQHYGHDAKIQLVENLWQVALADGRLDKYEEQFIRKISGLLHVAHADFIKAKLRAKDNT
jgi:uncharacterized tellurite resistance protein B-like protein